MKEKTIFSSYQIVGLVVLRILIGWHFLYEGMVKLFNPGWTSASFLSESKWIFSSFFHWIAKTPTALNLVDFINEWSLVLIGIGLISGLFARYAAIGGGVLLLLYYIAVPPLIGLEYSFPSEGNYLIVNKTLIEAAALFIVVLFPTSSAFGLDYFITTLKKKRKI